MEKCSRIKCEFFTKGKDTKPCGKCKEQDKLHIAKNTAILNRAFSNIKI